MSKPQWSQLPEDLLSVMIEKHLNTRIDNLRLRSVCRSWRSSIPLYNKPLPPRPPVPLRFRNCKGVDGYFSPIKSTIYLLQPKFPKQLNLLNFRITKIGKSYRLCFNIDPSEELEEDEPYYSFYSSSSDDDSPLFEKVVVSSSPWSGVDDQVVMAIEDGKLWFFKLGDKEWTRIAGWEQSQYSYHDLVHHKGQFYAVGCRGMTLVIGPDLNPKPIASFGPHYGCDERLRLVKSCVFKLNETEKKWEQILSLGDRVLFAFDACSYSVSAPDFSGLKGDCIYFSEPLFAEYEGTGVFSFVDNKCRPLAYFPDHSQIFWPPPPWLKPTACAIKK
ncbi:F-box protein SKIP23-like [Cornus florida]|uniref:F-box protein SKIP23-like n=1 Tax=Cornus florida TaxID=4283 RepID=UPI00289E29B3|nr:F-box protein SKIP23-like [Cornus florida]